MPRKTLSRNQRLLKASLFREAFAQKRSFPGRTMVLFLRSGNDTALRLGVVTSKKVSNRAVDRNLARRRLREIFRQHRSELFGAADVVLIGRRNLLSTTYEETEREFIRLVKKAGLMKSSKHETPKFE